MTYVSHISTRDPPTEIENISGDESDAYAFTIGKLLSVLCERDPRNLQNPTLINFDQRVRAANQSQYPSLLEELNRIIGTMGESYQGVIGFVTDNKVRAVPGMNSATLAELYKQARYAENSAKLVPFYDQINGVTIFHYLSKGEKRVLLIGESHRVSPSPSPNGLDLMKYYQENTRRRLDIFVESPEITFSPRDVLNNIRYHFLVDKDPATMIYRYHPFDLRQNEPIKLELAWFRTKYPTIKTSDDMVEYVINEWHTNPVLQRAKQGVDNKMIDHIFSVVDRVNTRGKRFRDEFDKSWLGTGSSDDAVVFLAAVLGIVIDWYLLLMLMNPTTGDAVVYGGQEHIKAYQQFLADEGFISHFHNITRGGKPILMPRIPPFFEAM